MIIDVVNCYLSSVVIGGGNSFPWAAEELTNDTLIVPLGTSGAWDDTAIREIGNILHDPSDTGKEYKLLYSAHSGAYTDTTVYLGYAYSSDAVTWTKSSVSAPIIARALEDPYVVKSGSTYYLYAEDKADTPFRNMRCYTSTDFSTWSDQGDILDIGNDWEEADVSSPTVWIDGAVWHMLYEGRHGSSQYGAIGHATSSDGLAWTKDPRNPVFFGTNAAYNFAGLPWPWAVVPDDVKLLSDGRLVLWFHALDDGTLSPWRDGVAVGTDVYSFEDLLGGGATIPIADTGGTVMFNPAFEPVRFIFADGGVVSPTGIYMAQRATPTIAAPSFSANPSIATPSGWTGVGDTLIATPGTHNGFASLYQWKRDGVAISGATGLSYTLVSGDLGANITFTHSVVNSTAETIAESNSLGPVATPATTTRTRTISGGGTRTLSDASNRTIADRTA